MEGIFLSLHVFIHFFWVVEEVRIREGTVSLTVFEVRM